MMDLSFSWQIEEFMVYCHTRQLRRKTMNSYEQALRLFERWCADEFSIVTVDKVTESVIRRYITSLQERGKYSFYADDKKKKFNYPERRTDYQKQITITTINNYLRNLRVFFNWLEQEYVLQKNPMRRIRQLKENRKAKEYIDNEEFKRLTSQLDKSRFSEHRDLVMIILMMDSGMRLGECSCLLVSDINLASRKIFLRAEITKGRQDRVVYFSSKTERILRQWLQFKDRYSESEYVFPVRKNGMHVKVRGFEGNFRNYLERANLNKGISPHCLRNNFAKRCLMSGMDIYTLSKILGHSSVTVTEKAYLDLIEDDLGKRYQNFSPILNM